MKKKKVIIAGIVVAIVLGGILFNLQQKNISQMNEIRNTNDDILYYTCGMHPSVKVSPEEYSQGNVNCPICNMKLTPVYSAEGGSASGGKEQVTETEGTYYGCGMEGAEHVFLIKEEKLKNCPICAMPLKRLTKEEADKLRGVVGKVKIEGKQVQLAGVKTETVIKHHLFKEIRTVGKVAYDPQLAIAQEEFISSLRALDKMQQGNIVEIKERAANLAESAKNKLRLLGLSEEQIRKLGDKREIQRSLILPEKKMWIYGDAYEYELIWVKVGEKVIVTTSSFPSEEFKGVISSVNPVVDPKTRSVRFRAEVDNPDLKLKPQMYVDVVIQSMYIGTEADHMVLALPKDAVLDTGTRKIVWVEKGTGEYEGREVRIGPEATATKNEQKAKFYPILSGLSENELVVTKANFLIDSQSQISGVAASAYGGALGAEEKAAPPVHQH